MLCFGADGHVAVEPADHEHTLPRTNKVTGAPVSGLKTGEDPCFDLPVVSGDHDTYEPLSRPQSPLLDEGLAVAVWAIALFLFPKAIVTPLFSPDPPIIDSRLVALRSVVLLN